MVEKAENEAKFEHLKKNIRTIPDYPKKEFFFTTSRRSCKTPARCTKRFTRWRSRFAEKAST